jgi:hypothetical protein
VFLFIVGRTGYPATAGRVTGKWNVEAVKDMRNTIKK